MLRAYSSRTGSLNQAKICKFSKQQWSA